MSYVTIQVIWLLCIFVTPPALKLYPSKLWALPFCLVTVANGLHMILFRYEYNAVLRRAMRILPYAQYLTPLREQPRSFLPLGTAYTVWTGVGAVGSFFVGIAALGEPVNVVRLAAALLIVSGIVLMKVSAS